MPLSGLVASRRSYSATASSLRPAWSRVRANSSEYWGAIRAASREPGQALLPVSRLQQRLAVEAQVIGVAGILLDRAGQEIEGARRIALGEQLDGPRRTRRSRA